MIKKMKHFIISLIVIIALIIFMFSLPKLFDNNKKVTYTGNKIKTVTVEIENNNIEIKFKNGNNKTYKLDR
jgi:competence protein ComGC